MQLIKRVTTGLLTLLIIISNLAMPVFSATPIVSPELYNYSVDAPYISYNLSPKYDSLKEKIDSISYRTAGKSNPMRNALNLKVLGEINSDYWNEAFALLKVKKVSSISYYWEGSHFFEEFNEIEEYPLGFTVTNLRILDMYSWGVSEILDFFSNDIEIGSEFKVIEYHTFNPQGEMIEFKFDTYDELFVSQKKQCALAGYIQKNSTRFCRPAANPIEDDMEYLIYLNQYSFYYDENEYDYSPIRIYTSHSDVPGGPDERHSPLLPEDMSGWCAMDIIPKNLLPEQCFYDYQIIDFTQERYREAMEYLRESGYTDLTHAETDGGISNRERHALNIVRNWLALGEMTFEPRTDYTLVYMILSFVAGVIISATLTTVIILRKRKTAAVPTDPTLPTDDEAPPEE